MYHSRSRGVRDKINSIKHVVDVQQALAIGVVDTGFLIITVDAPDSTITNFAEVQTGSNVYSIYLTVEATASTSAALANVYMIIYKSPGDNIPALVPNTIGSNDDAKWVIHEEMVMLERSTAGNPRNIFKGVIRLPKKMQRFGRNDRLVIALLSPGVTVDNCFQCIFKEYR